MIQALADSVAFRDRRQRAWDTNLQYWLTQPLRHVIDLGDQIVATIAAHTAKLSTTPVVLDMGFGNAWLLRGLLKAQVHCTYIGLDLCPAFVTHARHEFARCRNACFEVADFEGPIVHDLSADIVVNAFNFFELADLSSGMSHAASYLKAGGSLLAWTIDKTYLLMALSKDWKEFRENLVLYQTIPGTKYGFQAIDLGSGPSSQLEYPSVLYSLADFLVQAESHGMFWRSYNEFPFTAKPVPKIYWQLEFVKGPPK